MGRFQEGIGRGDSWSRGNKESRSFSKANNKGSRSFSKANNKMSSRVGPGRGPGEMYKTSSCVDPGRGPSEEKQQGVTATNTTVSFGFCDNHDGSEPNNWLGSNGGDVGNNVLTSEHNDGKIDNNKPTSGSDEIETAIQEEWQSESEIRDAIDTNDNDISEEAVSYTHLTLPTILLV